eukprot:snap_masked-scaffold_7-processed-gene-8.36-mRNA-1 protein AED:1.00 eAED:1.00 QI:0/0/0/0/1/1/2/0/324
MSKIKTLIYSNQIQKLKFSRDTTLAAFKGEPNAIVLSQLQYKVLHSVLKEEILKVMESKPTVCRIRQITEPLKKKEYKILRKKIKPERFEKLECVDVFLSGKALNQLLLLFSIRTVRSFMFKFQKYFEGDQLLKSLMKTLFHARCLQRLCLQNMNTDQVGPDFCKLLNKLPATFSHLELETSRVLIYASKITEKDFKYTNSIFYNISKTDCFPHLQEFKVDDQSNQRKTEEYIFTLLKFMKYFKNATAFELRLDIKNPNAASLLFSLFLSLGKKLKKNSEYYLTKSEAEKKSKQQYIKGLDTRRGRYDNLSNGYLFGRLLFQSR